MPSLSLNRVALSARLRIPARVFDKYLPASPVRVGEELAENVHELVQREHLGYYPALEFFRGREGFDENLLDAADHIAWIATSLVRDEVQTKLRPVFSTVRFNGIQCLAFTLPSIRPGQPNALQRLARHYTPDAVKLDLELTLLRKDQANEGLDRFASHVVCRWLKQSFASLEITSTQLISSTS